VCVCVYVHTHTHTISVTHTLGESYVALCEDHTKAKMQSSVDNVLCQVQTEAEEMVVH
jgi:hypothetical protein